MNTLAVVLEGPERLALSPVELLPPGDDDVVVDVEWSGISTGTERLLWSGRMPAFPGMGYPLVPGYESVGRIRAVGAGAGDRRVGDRVFVPGSRGFSNVRGLFGGAAARVVLPAARAVPVAESLGEEAVLLALAATAQHAIAGGPQPPDLIVGHGVLGRLLARLVVAAGGPAPTVWETNADRQAGADGYTVCHPDADARRDYRAICDVSGDARILDQREARLRVAAEWRAEDLARVMELLAAGRLSLAGLITHRESARAADAAYRTAFGDPACLKMILDWRSVA